MGLTGKPVTVRRYVTDRFGDRTLVAIFIVAHCAFAPRVSTEATGRDTTVIADAELYAPPHSGIEATDEVELADGTRWEVQGRPETWESPFTTLMAGDVIALRRVTG